MQSESVILEEDIDENYEPTQEEIEEYAHFLQMDFVEDADLLWIAKEGLKAPLPEPWKPCKTRDDEIYYFNFETGESTWEHPCDDYYRKQYLAHKAQKNKKAAGSDGKKKRIQDPALAFDFVDSSASKKLGNPGLGPLKGFDDKDKDPVLKFEMEKKLKKEKQELEERYSAEVTQINKEFEDKRTALKRNYDKDLDMLKKQDAIRREEAQLELKRWLDQETDKAKTLAQKQVETEENIERENIRKSQQQKLELLGKEFAQRLQNEQKRIQLQLLKDRESLLQSEEAAKLSEVNRLTSELEKSRSRISSAKSIAQDRESKVKSQLSSAEAQMNQELKEAVLKLRSETALKLSQEKTATEARILQQSENLKSQGSEESRKMMAAMQMKEAEIRGDAAARTKKMEMDAELNFLSEKETLQEEFITHMRQVLESESLKAKAAYAQELEAYKQKVQRDIIQEKQNKERELNISKADYQKRLAQDLEAERLHVEEELRKRVSQHSTEAGTGKTELRSQVLRLREAVSDAQADIDAIDQECQRVSDSIADVQRQRNRLELEPALEEPSHRESVPVSQPQPEALIRLEKDLESLKQMIIVRKENSISPIPNAEPAAFDRSPDISKWKSALQREKQELKEHQKALELDQDRWRLDVKQYENNPGSRSRIELQSVKKAIDAKARKLNEKVKELRTAEKWLAKKESEGPERIVSLREILRFRPRRRRISREVIRTGPGTEQRKSLRTV